MEAGEFEKALAFVRRCREDRSLDSHRCTAAANTRNMIQQADGSRAGGTCRSASELSAEIMDAQGPVKLSGISGAPVHIENDGRHENDLSNDWETGWRQRAL